MGHGAGHNTTARWKKRRLELDWLMPRFYWCKISTFQRNINSALMMTTLGRTRGGWNVWHVLYSFQTVLCHFSVLNELHKYSYKNIMNSWTNEWMNDWMNEWVNNSVPEPNPDCKMSNSSTSPRNDLYHVNCNYFIDGWNDLYHVHAFTL